MLEVERGKADWTEDEEVGTGSGSGNAVDVDVDATMRPHHQDI